MGFAPNLTLPVAGPSASFVLKTTFRLWEDIDSPVSLSCWLLAKHNEWDQLVSRKVDPLAYSDATDFMLDYLAVSVLSKAEFLQTSYDRREAAVRTFQAAEASCREANERLTAYMEGRISPRNREVHLALQRAIRITHGALGKRPTTGFRPKFGPGATSLVSRLVCVAEKYRRRVDVTPGLFPFLLDVVGPRWLRDIDEVWLNASNKVSFVPKNAKTFRTIAVEPHVNGYAQLGVSASLRGCILRKFRLDLTKQADVNRHLASIAQAYGLATVDLSSASDTVSRAAVWLLLPEGWASVLDSVRSHYGVLDGLEFEYEKFSSMGNGTTFELETLIFYAVARACGGSKNWTSVFGDDIIVESEVCPLLFEALDFLGFKVNKEKTFVDGPFRESCGEDYYHGNLVRPFFWKDLDVPTWFKVPNDIRSLSQRLRKERPLVSRRLHHTWMAACRSLPRWLDVRVPDGFGSFGIVDEERFVEKRFLVRRREAYAVGVLPGDTEVNTSENPVQTSVATAPLDVRASGWDGFFFTGWVFKPDPVPIDASERALLHCLDGGGYEGLGKTSFRGIGLWKKTLIYALGSAGHRGFLCSTHGMYTKRACRCEPAADQV